MGQAGWLHSAHQANAVDYLYKLNPAILCHLFDLED